MALDNYRGHRYGGSSSTLLSGRIYPQGVFNWQFSPSVQSAQLIHRCWEDKSSKKKKKSTNILLKAFCHTSNMKSIFTSMKRWNQMLVVPVGWTVQRSTHCFWISKRAEVIQGRECVINLTAAAQSVSAKDKERGRKKNWWSAFTILCSSPQDWSFLFPPVPHRVRGQRLVSDVCLGSRIVVFTRGQDCFE